MKQVKLMIVRGIPGSGKSTFAKKLADKYHVAHFENDMFLMVNGKYDFSYEKHKIANQKCKEAVTKCLRQGKSCIVSNVLHKASSVQKYVNIAENCGAIVMVVRVNGKHQNVHNVPDKVVQKFIDEFEDFPGELNI